jgi:hypothetical protein
MYRWMAEGFNCILIIIYHHHNHHHHHHNRHHHHNQHHHQLYNHGWALASWCKCRQRSLSWVSGRQFLQPSFIASSSTPSIHLNFGRVRPGWPPVFVYIILGNSFSSIRTKWHAHIRLVDIIPFAVFGSCKGLPVLYCAPPPRPTLPTISDQMFCGRFSYRSIIKYRE